MEMENAGSMGAMRRAVGAQSNAKLPMRSSTRGQGTRQGRGDREERTIKFDADCSDRRRAVRSEAARGTDSHTARSVCISNYRIISEAEA